MSFPCTKWAWKQPLLHAEKIVLLALAEHADERNECFPSMATLAEECGMCRRNILRVVEKLVEKKLIFIKKRVTAHGKSSHDYTLNTAIIMIKTPCDSQSQPDVTHSHTYAVTHSHIEPNKLLDTIHW
jgi:hypothetical protein